MFYEKEIKTTLEDIREIAVLVGKKFDAKHLQEIHLVMEMTEDGKPQVIVKLVGLED